MTRERLQRRAKREARPSLALLGPLVWPAAVGITLLMMSAGCSEEEGETCGNSCGPCSGEVARVIDGDTIELANVGRLRFADLDAPELDEPGGPEARDRLAEEIEGQIVEVEFVRRKADGMPVRDRWGRLLGTIGP